MTTVKDIYDYIDEIAPFSSMEEWDNSGFICGDINKQVSRVVMSLDACASAADFAASVGADLLLTHHPLIFKPVKNIEKGTALYTLIASDIAVLSAHTSFDRAKGGINDNLASLLGLCNTAHLGSGYLVVGDLTDGMSIDDFALFVSQTLGVHGLRYTDTDRIISRVAVGGGACGEYLEEAMENSDCFVTGELKYHELLYAAENNFAAVAAGHFETENLPFLMMKERLAKAFTDVEFITADVENPVFEI